MQRLADTNYVTPCNYNGGETIDEGIAEDSAMYMRFNDLHKCCSFVPILSDRHRVLKYLALAVGIGVVWWMEIISGIFADDAADLEW